MYADTAIPYANSANTSITSPTYDVSGADASMDFWTQCDTEYSINEWRDYMVLEMSGDGSNFTQIERWDEASLDALNGESPVSGTGYTSYHFSNISIPLQYRTANFKFRLQWVTNASDNNYDGCFIDDVKILTFSDGSDEKYGFMQGTSMAAPHVAGLAALLMGYNPALTTTQVKDTILSSGDSLGSLSGKTVSGKRINAERALLTSVPEKAITLFNFTTPTTTGIINGSTKTVVLTVPYGTDVTTLRPTITVSPGALVSPASDVVHDFSASSTYTVTAVDGTTQAYTIVVIVAPNSAKDITSFSFPEGTGIISGTTISVTVPYGTNVSLLTPTINITGMSVSPASGIAQNFNSPITYTVTALDNSTQIYTVTVNVLPGGGKSGGGGGGGGGSSKSKKIVPKTYNATTSIITRVAKADNTSVSVSEVVPNGFVFLIDLSIGVQNKSVTELQKRLIHEGVYNGATSGYFGQLTLHAVKAYQSKVGISPTGYVGPQTREKLNATQIAGIDSVIDPIKREVLIASLKAQLTVLLQQLELLLKKEGSH